MSVLTSDYFSLFTPLIIKENFNFMVYINLLGPRKSVFCPRKSVFSTSKFIYVIPLIKENLMIYMAKKWLFSPSRTNCTPFLKSYLELRLTMVDASTTSSLQPPKKKKTFIFSQFSWPDTRTQCTRVESKSNIPTLHWVATSSRNTANDTMQQK